MPNQQMPQNNQIKQSNQQNQNQKSAGNAGTKEAEMNRNANAGGPAAKQSGVNARTNDRNSDVGKDTDGDGRPVQSGHKAGEIDGDRQNRNKH